MQYLDWLASMIANKKPRTSYADIPQDTKDRRNQRRRELNGNLPVAARAKRNEHRKLVYAESPDTYSNLPQSIKDKRNERRKQLRSQKKKNSEESTRPVCSTNRSGNFWQNMIRTMVPTQTVHPTNSEVVTEPLPAATISTDEDATKTFVAGVITKVSRSFAHCCATSIHEIGNLIF